MTTADGTGWTGPLGDCSEQARAAFARCVRGVLAHRADGAAALAETLACAPALVPAAATRGFALRALGRADRRPAIDGILRGLAPRGGRERALASALRAWRDDDGPRAAALLDARLAEAPRDLLLAKLAHGLHFMLGDAAGMRRSIERALAAFGEDDPGHGFLLGCHAFALEETGELERAEAVGRRAVEQEPDDVWGAHAVAHALYMRGRHREGALWLRGYASRLEGCTNLAGHVAWHEALFLIELGRPAEALRLFDERVALWLDADYRDVSNGASLLFRLERLGVDVGDRWARYAAFALEREGDHASPFADVHYALALAASGRVGLAARFVASMRAAAGDGFDATVRREVGVPLAAAIVDRFSGRSREAARALERLREETVRIGGSHAQRHLLGWIHESARADAALAGAHP